MTMTMQIAEGSIEQGWLAGVVLPVDPATADTVEVAVVPRGTAPTGWAAATVRDTEILPDGRWKFTIVTHTLGATGADQVLTRGTYDVWWQAAAATWDPTPRRQAVGVLRYGPPQ